MKSPRRILVLAPHPDDEVVACAVAALRARAAGARVFVLYLTSGVPEHAGGWLRAPAPYSQRVARRRREALLAAALLGLEPAGFAARPSRQLRGELDAAAREIGAAIGAYAPEAIWVPAFEGGHQDHDAANALAAAVAGPLPVWEFAAYNFAGGQVRANRFAQELGGEDLLVATPEEAAIKRRALACYRSERGNLRHLGATHEAWRPLPAYDYAAPPHPGRLFRERFHWVPLPHPRIDFALSSEVYRDIGRWHSARRPSSSIGHDAIPTLDDRPGGEARQPDCELARPLDEAEREPTIRR